jgi:orotate phosphoribosyltransferase
MPVISIGNLDDLLEYISDAGAHPGLVQYSDAVSAYRRRYGVAQDSV